jgi:hypothetical protein
MKIIESIEQISFVGVDKGGLGWLLLLWMRVVAECQRALLAPRSWVALRHFS